jgi:hypothetical protein
MRVIATRSEKGIMKGSLGDTNPGDKSLVRWDNRRVTRVTRGMYREYKGEALDPNNLEKSLAAITTLIDEAFDAGRMSSFNYTILTGVISRFYGDYE